MKAVAHSREHRLRRAAAISDALVEHFGKSVIAIGAYGSTGRGEDRPFSDLEMLCVVQNAQGIDYLYWVEDGLKISVDILGADEIVNRVQTVEENWPITGSEYTSTLALHDPGGFWESLQPLQDAIPDQIFRGQIRGVMLGYIFEYLCKLKNGHARASFGNFPYLATEVAQCGTWLMGLHHRHLYQSNTSHFEECLGLANRPEGLDQLIKLVTAGQLSDPEHVLRCVEQFWTGAVAWCRGLQIPLESSFAEELLKLPTCERA